MFAEHLHRHIAGVFAVWNNRDVEISRTRSFLGQHPQILVTFEVDKRAFRFDRMNKLAEGVHVFRESGEHIDMIPRDAGQNSYMRMVPKKFGPQVEWGSEILVALKNRVFGGVGQAYHAFETLNLRTHHIIGFDAEALQHIEDHRSGGRLAVTAAYDDTDLILGLLVQVFGEGVNLQSQFPCFHQFGIIFAGMHAEDDRIDVRCDTLGVPAHLVGQQTCIAQVGQSGIEDLVVRSGHFVSLLGGHSECQVMHRRTAYSYEMDVSHR